MIRKRITTNDGITCRRVRPLLVHRGVGKSSNKLRTEVFQLVRRRGEMAVACAILLELDTTLSMRHTARGNGRSMEVRLVAVLRNKVRQKVLL